MTILLFIFLLTIIASFIQRVSGFGFGIFVMMFFPFFLPSYGESVMLSGLLAGSTALLIAKVGFYSDDTILWWTTGLMGGLIGTSLGTRCFEAISNHTLKRIVYVLMMISGAVAIFK